MGNAGRTALARALLEPSQAQAIQAVGLLSEDLEAIKTHGEEAEKQDRLQRDDLAAQRFGIETLMQARKDVDEETDELRSRLPAVHLDLSKSPATADQASWLATASFERFRLRLLSRKPTEGTEANPERERVARTDRLSRALAASQFVSAILATERTPIVEALTKRGFPRTRIEALEKASKELADNLGGKVTMTASSHTELEAIAVAAQTEYWKACRRMLAKIAKSDPELADLWAAC